MTRKEKLDVFVGTILGLVLGGGLVTAIFTLAAWRVSIGW